VHKLLIASRNPDKIAELRALLAGTAMEVFSLLDFEDLPATLEDQDTLRGNAAKKALEAAKHTGMLCLADDTGLFIDALDGQPGIYAARFAGEHCSYKDNRDKALRMLEGVSDRRAEFRTCAVLAAPDGVVAFTEGIMPGSISTSERGSNGFGYDSIFIPEPGERSYAEMTDTEKNAHSHRAKALEAMLPILKDIMESDKEVNMIEPQVFRQYDIRGIVDEELNEESYYLIGKGFGSYLRQQGLKTIALGGDARLTTPKMMQAFVKGALETGCDITDIGIVATPVLYYAIWKLKTDAGAMVTASHNPSQYNGCKLNLGLGSVYAEELQKVLKIIQAGDFASGAGRYAKDDSVNADYIDYITANIHLERPVKVAIDGGNGMGGPYLPEILSRLGCELIEMYCEPDGTFPNHHPDPTVAKNMVDLARAVVEAEYELGIGLDGDADRIGVVDEKGKMLFGDQILNILARDYLKTNQGKTIIADVKCSKNLYDDIRKHGGVPMMYKTGHANIKMKMKEIGVDFAGEMSGHVFLGDRYLGFDDAIYVSCRLIEIVSQTDAPVSTYLADQPKMYNTPELHLKCADERKFEVVARVCEEFKAEGYDVNDIDGARITFSDGWGLVRASNTTPVLVTRFEAESEARMHEIQALIEGKINKYL